MTGVQTCALPIYEARLLLRQIGALDDNSTLIDQGRNIRALALPPRLARMVVESAHHGQAQLAADLAATLVERGLGGDSLDLCDRVERFRRDRSRRAQDAHRLANGWAQQAKRFTDRDQDDHAATQDCGRLITLAYPDRIAKARGKTGEFIMANGRALGMGAADGFVKVLADAATDEILGVHVIGNAASDLIAEAVVAMEFKAAAEDIGRVCHPHPSLSEVMREAALATDKRALNM